MPFLPFAASGSGGLLVFGELFLLLSPGFQLVFDIGYSDKDRNKAYERGQDGNPPLQNEEDFPAPVESRWKDGKYREREKDNPNDQCRHSCLREFVSGEEYP